MGKRKLGGDFQKTKLRVGRQLPKGKNITDTSFKTKQIITPDQLSTALNDKPLTALLKLLLSKNSPQKIDALTKITHYITDNKDSLHLYFPDILSSLGKVLLESDPEVTVVAVDVMSVCFKRLTDIQYKSFSESMVMHLTCMMTHCATSVRKNSLKLLDVLLSTHPKIVSQSPKILTNLLNLISSKKRAVKGRKLDEIVSTIMTSFEWRLHVFKRMLIFLQAMKEVENKEAAVEDEHEVHWDGKTPLYLPLYMSGGLQPVELDFSWYSQVKESDCREFKSFVAELVPMLSDALKGEISSSVQHSRLAENSVILHPVIVQYFNIIVQVLCHIGEWDHQHLNSEESIDENVLKQIKSMVSCQFLRGFPFAEHDPSEDKKTRQGNGSECVQLNLGICYLFTMFALESEEIKLIEKREAILTHLMDVFNIGNQLCDKSIFLILQIGKRVVQSQNISINFKNGTLAGLYGILEIHKEATNSKMLYSFFIELSLDYEFRDLLSTEGMINWFQALFLNLDDMMKSGNVNLELLKYIRKVCTRKYPQFMKFLNKVSHKELLEYLQYNHEEFQLTVIHMILALDEWPDDLLSELSTLICQEHLFPSKLSCRLIYSFHTRFLKPETSMKDKLIFTKFLLNVACDTGYLKTRSSDCNDADIEQMLLEVLSHTEYRIYPTKKWQTHQKVFEVCLECLHPYAKDNTLCNGISVFAKALLLQPNDTYEIPVHIVLAYLHIWNKYPQNMCGDVKKMTCYLILASFMYISVVINEVPTEDRGLYCVPELHQCLLNCTVGVVTQMIFKCIDVILNLPETEMFYMLKIILFLSRQNKIPAEHKPVRDFLLQLGRIAAQSDILRPLWNKICNG